MSCQHYNRRQFLKQAVVTGLSATVLPWIDCIKTQTKEMQMKGSVPTITGLAIARGADDPTLLVREAIKAAGGIQKFISKGDIVIIKPNIGWSRTPEQAANTNPEIVETVIELCMEAGAKKVKVFDLPCNPTPRAYRMSGIETTAKKAGADIYFMDDRKFRDITIPMGEAVKSWRMYTEIFEADKLINIPILKHHSMARLTMGMKNNMGLIGGNRESIHTQFDQKLVDLCTVIKPHLTIMDAYRVLTANGPNSGTPDDVVLAKHVIVGTDPIAVDSYGVQLFGTITNQPLTAHDIEYIRLGNLAGLGEIDLSKISVNEIDLS
ncbi:DUF362 domain-containing protein [candidate division KSB1 bacterium]|nr:DUF362 domain-containing protein [candidate division KSB1 bacterium]